MITVYDQLVEQSKRLCCLSSLALKFFIIKIKRKTFWQDVSNFSCKAETLWSHEFIIFLDMLDFLKLEEEWEAVFNIVNVLYGYPNWGITKKSSQQLSSSKIAHAWSFFKSRFTFLFQLLLLLLSDSVPLPSTFGFCVWWQPYEECW